MERQLKQEVFVYKKKKTKQNTFFHFLVWNGKSSSNMAVTFCFTSKWDNVHAACLPFFFLWNQIWVFIFVRNSKLARVPFFACSVVVASAVVFVTRVKQQHIADTCSPVTIYCFISSFRCAKCEYSKKYILTCNSYVQPSRQTSAWINLHINVLFLFLYLFIYYGCSHVL